MVDETGDVKKGRASAGVQRQYTGTAGRVENCQVAVFLSYAAPAGHALIDRELYLPKSWIADAARCAAAGIPAETAFATKPKLARVMIARALDAGVPAGWVTGDEVYGGDPGLRADLECRHVGYVLAVAKDHPVTAGLRACRADKLTAGLPPHAWQCLSAGPGATGHRYYDWAWVAIGHACPGHRWLLIRRNRRTRQLAFYRFYCPRHVPLPALVKIAGIRWTTEENFQASKGLTGLDEHQVRRWGSWYRWTTLAMLALAFLSIAATTEHSLHPPPADQIPLTRNEIAALFNTLIIEPVRTRRHWLRWSIWRRRAGDGATGTGGGASRILPVPGALVRPPGRRMVQSRSQARRSSSAAVFAVM